MNLVVQSQALASTPLSQCRISTLSNSKTTRTKLRDKNN